MSNIKLYSRGIFKKHVSNNWAEPALIQRSFQRTIFDYLKDPTYFGSKSDVGVLRRPKWGVKYGVYRFILTSFLYVSL